MGGHHSHDLNPPPRAPMPLVKVMTGVIGLLAIVTLVAVVWMWPSEKRDVGDQAAASEDRSQGTIVGIERRSCPPSDAETGMQDLNAVNGCGTATVKLTSGRDEGTRVVVPLPSGPGAVKVAKGDDVELIYTNDASGRRYDIVDHQRSTELWLLAIAFALAVIAFGRLRGFSALIGLAFTFAMLLMFIVPAMLDGQGPLLVAIVGSAAIMIVVLYLTHGINVPTSIALLGTLASLALTGVLAAFSAAQTHLDGVTDESSMYLGMLHGVDMRGLLLAGIIIGSLGVLDDVTVTQSVTVTELAVANPQYGFVRLYRAASRVGRAHIASVINTIVLAYAGASLPLLLLIAAGNAPIGQVLTTQLITQEIVRSVISTLGLIAAVPITTALAAFAASRTPRPALESEPPSHVEPPARSTADERSDPPPKESGDVYEALAQDRPRREHFDW